MSTPKVHWLIKAQDILEESLAARIPNATVVGNTATAGSSDPAAQRKVL
jgi:hypothetical protein